MAKKRSTLPKETDALLAAGDIEGLKSLFAKCEPNALYINKFGSNIFSRTPLPREFAFWAREQGADVNFIDHYSKTPIFYQASAWNGDVQLLIGRSMWPQAASRRCITPPCTAVRKRSRPC